jgi:Flp pilus assembly protein TadD
MLLVLLGIVLAGGGAGAWWWTSGAVRPVDPPMPADVPEREVRAAIERARQEVLAKPQSAAAWGNLGLVLAANSCPKEADLCFREAARLDPADGFWPYCRAMINQLDDSEQALPLFRQAADRKVAPEYRPAMRLRLAEVLLGLGKAEEAEALYREEWERAPGHPRTALGLGQIALHRGDHKAAVDYLLLARTAPFARKVATAHLALAYRMAGDDKTAEAYDRETNTLPEDPPWPDPYLGRAVEFQAGRRGRERDIARLESRGLFREAAAAWLKQIEEEGPTSSACFNAGSLYSRAGDYNRALPLLRQAVSLERNSDSAHYGLAVALFKCSAELEQRSPNSAEARDLLREACDHAQRAAELKPADGGAYLVWGASLKRLGKREEAISPLRRGIDRHPEDLQLYLTLGEALLELRRFPEAEVELENARQLDPKDPRPAAALELLRKKKEKKEQ